MADWQVGDLALCIKMGPWRRFSRESREFLGEVAGPHAGQIYVVVEVNAGCIVPVLLRLHEFPMWPKHRGFNAERFRKIEPHTPDAFDRETIELMQRKPVEA